MCKYVWDFVVVTGGIGLVIFAVAITLELKEKMQGIMDSCDVS